MNGQLLNISGTTNFLWIENTSLRKIDSNGSGFSAVAFALDSNFVSVCDAGGGVLYVIEQGGSLQKSIDYGDTWSSIGSVNLIVNSMIALANGTLLMSIDDGGTIELHVYDIDINGLNLVFSNEVSGSPAEFIEIPGKIFAGDAGGQLWESSNNGQSWSGVTIPSEIASIKSFLKIAQ